MDALTDQEKAFLASDRWYGHLVFSEDTAKKSVNYHTHGLPEHFGHLDFQVVLPLDRETLHALATTLVDRVKNGERFADGMRVSGVARNFDVLLFKTTETSSELRPVLRVIFPDERGNLDKASLEGIFIGQFDVTD